MAARRTILVLAVGLWLSTVVLSRFSASASQEAFEGTKTGQARSDNGLKTTLVWIPPGKFTRGSPKDEKGRLDNEGPIPMTLPQGFWLGKCEVTQAEWQNVMHTTPWRGQKDVLEGDNYPASFVSWDDARKFCEEFTRSERQAGRLPIGWKYTLPTEAQWEYACRAGTTTPFSFGDDEAKLTDYGWFEGNTSRIGERYAHAVGQKKGNPWGLHDMHGNVYEWCSDGGETQADRVPGGANAAGPSAGPRRSDRGGGWEDPATKARSACRDFSPPDERNDDLGFRVVAVPSGK